MTKGIAIKGCVFASILSVSACASIVDGSQQSVSVTTIARGAGVAGASCELNNDKGTWYVNTPGSVTVHRSYDALNVKCEKPGMAPGIAAVESHTKGMAFGNIIAGGIIGGAVDMSTGAAYDYPNPIVVEMGTTRLQKPEPQKTTASSSSEAKPTS